MGLERETPEQEARRLLAESTARLNEARERYKTYWSLIKLAAGEFELAYDAYMGGDRIEDWEEFDKHALLGTQALKDAIRYMPDYTPLWVEEMWKATIEKIANFRIDYWEKWGKRLKDEEVARVMKMERWSCANLLANGIPHGDMESVAGEAYCKNECRFREGCDREGL